MKPDTVVGGKLDQSPASISTSTDVEQLVRHSRVCMNLDGVIAEPPCRVGNGGRGLRLSGQLLCHALLLIHAAWQATSLNNQLLLCCGRRELAGSCPDLAGSWIPGSAIKSSCDIPWNDDARLDDGASLKGNTACHSTACAADSNLTEYLAGGSHIAEGAIFPVTGQNAGIDHPHLVMFDFKIVL